MATPTTAIADTPKKALEDYLIRLGKSYYSWYERSVKRHRWLANPLQVAALLSGFAPAILTALAPQWLHNSGSERFLLIGLPAFGAAVMTAAGQFKLFERYRLREEGRLGIQTVLSEGKIRYAAATSDQEYTAIHAELVNQVKKIEEDQSRGFFLLLASAPMKSNSANKNPEAGQ